MLIKARLATGKDIPGLKWKDVGRDFVQFLLHFSVQPSISGNALKLKGEDQGNN